MRGHAAWGLGRLDDARAAWKGAAQRYEELDEEKAAAAIHERLAHLEIPTPLSVRARGEAEVT